MRKRTFLWPLLAFAVIGVTGFLVVAWLTAPLNLTRIEDMEPLRQLTEAEATDYLGAAGSDALSRGSQNTGILNVEILDFTTSTERAVTWKEWRTFTAKRIQVGFDEAGKVIVVARFDVHASWFDKVRRWFRLVRLG